MYSLQGGEDFPVQARNACWGVGGWSYVCRSYLATSAVDGGRRPISLPCFFLPGEKALFPTEEVVEWTSVSVWTFRETELFIARLAI